MTPLIVAGALTLAVVAWVLVVRRRTAALVEVSTPLVVAGPPSAAIDRVEAAARGIRGYACERRERELVIFRRHEGPLGFFEDPQGLLSEATMDVLHVTAERTDGGTEIWLKGRSEPRVVARVRRALR